jgi:U3 small nucleolar RNA-associated protein 6
LDCMRESYAKEPSTCNCYVRQPLIGIDHHSPEFAVALGSSLNRLKESMEVTNNKTQLSMKTKAWIEGILRYSDLDPAIKTVLEHTARRLE